MLPDFEDFLRQNGLRMWENDSPEALAVRKKYHSDQSDRSDGGDKFDRADKLERYYEKSDALKKPDYNKLRK
jgi:hypothetical protein